MSSTISSGALPPPGQIQPFTTHSASARASAPPRAHAVLRGGSRLVVDTKGGGRHAEGPCAGVVWENWRVAAACAPRAGAAHDVMVCAWFAYVRPPRDTSPHQSLMTDSLVATCSGARSPALVSRLRPLPTRSVEHHRRLAPRPRGSPRGLTKVPCARPFARHETVRTASWAMAPAAARLKKCSASRGEDRCASSTRPEKGSSREDGPDAGQRRRAVYGRGRFDKLVARRHRSVYTATPWKALPVCSPRARTASTPDECPTGTTLKDLFRFSTRARKLEALHPAENCN